MNKILILGSNGMLGTYLTKHLSKNHKVIASTRNNFDLSKMTVRKFKKYLDSLDFRCGDFILNASGIIKQRKYDEIEMIKINSMVPYFLSIIKEKYAINVIHFSTDCVFNGDRDLEISLDEDYHHTCNDIYGKSKSLGEPNNLTIIRTSIIGEEKSNKKSLLEWVRSQKGKKVKGYNNHLWNGVTCLELSKQVEKIIEDNRPWDGVLHYHSPNKVSKYGLLKYINEIYELDLDIEEVSTEKNCYRNLSSNYTNPIKLDLYDQIKELKEFNINE
jgi:dTDP-4-dehydrorhamnose reductase